MVEDADFAMLCDHLALNAKRYALHEITLSEWYEKVHQLLLAHYGDALHTTRAAEKLEV